MNTESNDDRPADPSTSNPPADSLPGDASDNARLLRAAYDALHQLAVGYLRGERPDHTLQPTALVHEAYLKLATGKSRDWSGKTHFQAVAARAMRQILVDHARHRGRQKRGGAWNRVTLSSGVLGRNDGLDFIELDEALTRLADKDARKAQVVELRFFGGLTTAEAANELGISPKTAEADWYFARAWLSKELAEADQ